jgi:isopentenyl-diphosphate delta-isomerase
MALNRDLVVLVNGNDDETGTAGKLQAHLDGLLHRALSIFIINDRGDMLLQRRASGKYHSAGLWSNACCSHPCPGERTADAAARRLREELGFDTGLEEIGTLLYHAEVGEGLVEHELDHLFTGIWNGEPRPDPDEVSETVWMPVGTLRRRLEESPENFTAWFPWILDIWVRRQANLV